MSTIEIFKEFGFEAAHQLRNLPAEHKCARLHGHSFRVEVRVLGEVGDESGWVMDFADISAAWQPLHELLDHRYLNEIPGLETSPPVRTWPSGSGSGSRLRCRCSARSSFAKPAPAAAPIRVNNGAWHRYSRPPPG